MDKRPSAGMPDFLQPQVDDPYPRDPAWGQERPINNADGGHVFCSFLALVLKKALGAGGSGRGARRAGSWPEIVATSTP
jgi:hypothetical protein